MKILIIGILLCAGIAGGQLGPSNPFFVGAVLKPAAAGGGSASCPSVGSPDVATTTPTSGDDEESVTQQNPKYYVGQLITSTTSKDICRIRIYWGVGAGTPSANTYRCKLWTLSGNNLNTVIATADADVAGPTVGAWAEFNFSGHPTSGTAFAITVENVAGVDAADYPVILSDTPSSIAGNTAWWDNTKTLDGQLAAYDVGMEIYWYD